MGNNNSSASPPVQMGSQPPWSPPGHLDLGGSDDFRNNHRMKKGYAAKQYMGHRASPQKVLPTVNPTKAAKKLKPTSNGRNLKQCGTISGRKFNEFETAPNSSGNLIVGEMSQLRLSTEQQKFTKNSQFTPRQNGMSSPNLLETVQNFQPMTRLGKGDPSRTFHESEPDLNFHSGWNDFPNKVPVLASHVQETPAKKLIRTKKKKSAPPPPPDPKKSTVPLPLHEITKVHQRIFKTKADRKTSSSSIEVPSGMTTSPQSVTSSMSTSNNIVAELGRMGPARTPSLSTKTPNIIRMRNDKLNGSKEFDRKLTPKKSTPSAEIDKVQRYSPVPPITNGFTDTKNLQERKRFYFGMDLVDFGSQPSRPNLDDFGRSIVQQQKHETKLISEVTPTTFSYYKPTKDVKEESLSDNMSSSSEMDIVLRPTLPPKPQQLPKFSPSAAWNRIDLDSPNSSEEEALRFNLRKNAKGASQVVTKDRLGEGDSGISGLDGDGGGSPEILPPPLPLASNLIKGSCWTPEQDLDDSSSEFDVDDDEESQNRRQVQTSYPSSERPRLTTRSNFFTNSKSDTEQCQEPYRESKNEPIYARSTKSKTPVHVTITDSPSTVPEFKPSLNRIINYRRAHRLNKEVGLDANWFLSRSEPNSLNMTHLMIGDEAGPSSGRGIEEEEEGIRSENGYAPTSLKFEITGTSASEWNKSASLIGLSHFVYLPQQRQGYDDTTTKRNNRRAKSVENLLKQNENQGLSSSQGQNSVQNQLSHQSPQSNYNKRKKFKFQSTLKVMERKRIEKELSREAEEKEIERLKEIEAMKRVEEEFEKKRKSREKQLEEKLELLKPVKATQPVSLVTSLMPWEESHTKFNRRGQSAIRTTTPSQSSDNGSSTRSTSNITKVNLTQRQDPEGAPSIQDLRKELILGAKKRNGISSASSDLTQELSEYRQETRQYCDYRRSPRLTTEITGKSKSRTKFVDSTSSDIYPLTGRMPLMEKHRQRQKSTVVYPEIVCDIPNKPFPYTVNFSSRLSGSHTSLLIEDRPPSGIGFHSGPSSVISDNYRRDWAHPHHGSKHSGSISGMGGKSSSVTSLHTSDHIKIHHQSDLKTDRSSNSPRITHRVIGTRGGHRTKDASGPGATKVTITLNSPQQSGNFVEPSNDSDGFSRRKTETCLQPQSFINYKTKAYRPVFFNPTNFHPH